MSDGSLSQDEIDALLQGSGGMEFDEPSAPGQTASAEISNQDRKAFQRLIAQTVDAQASNFSMLVSKAVSIKKPFIDVVDAASFLEDLDDNLVQISLNFVEGISGAHSYILPESGATQIAGSMMGQEDADLDDAALNALQEAFSQVSSPLLTSIGDGVGAQVLPDVPEAVHAAKAQLSLPSGEFVKVVYPISMEGSDAFELVELFDAATVAEILDRAGLRTEAPPRPAPQQEAPRQQQPANFGGQPAFGGMQGYGMQQPGGAQVQSVQFPNLQGGNMQSEQGNISLLMDVYMEMTVELGRTKKLIKEILGMGEGTIIELDKLAGEPVDILVNHKLIAKGEVVVIDENFGVRVTEIVSTMERLNNMT